MDTRAPHYLLFSHTDSHHEPARWKVVLKASDGSGAFEASDTEPEARGERLELLAVVRGLEALDQPSHVTLVTSSRYVRRGLAYGLDEWRANGWAWERYGEMVPVKNRDLWQRLDRAMAFHRVYCRQWRLDTPHEIARGDRPDSASSGVASGSVIRPDRSHPGRPAPLAAAHGQSRSSPSPDSSRGAWRPPRPAPRRRLAGVPDRAGRISRLLRRWRQLLVPTKSPHLIQS